MEKILILLLAGILLFENKKAVQPIYEDIVDVLKNNRVGVLKYFGAAAVLFLVFQSLPALLLTVYMRKEGFFAYEVFAEDSHAIDVLSLNVLVNYLFVSMYLFLAAFTMVRNTGRWTIAGGVLVTVLIFAVFLYYTILTGNYMVFISIMLFCLTLGGYLFFCLTVSFNHKARYWWAPFLFVGLLIFLVVVVPDASAKLAKVSLAQMKVGGLKAEVAEEIDFKEPPHRNYIAGELLLRTSAFYYFRPDDRKDTILVIKTDHSVLRYKS